MVAIAQSMPGVVAVNSAVILGYRMAGVLGTLVALVATVLLFDYPDHHLLQL